MLATEHDDALVAGLRAGDSHAFEKLLREHGPRLLRLARRFLANEEDARDALQDAMVAVYRSVAEFKSGAALSTWLHRIVVNAALMKLRTKRRHPEEDIEQYLPRFLEDGHRREPGTAWAESADSVLEREELRGAVREAIAKLPDAYRIVLHLRDIEELSTAETAEILGTTKNIVKIRLHRARQALRTLLDETMK
ncbi:MAG TPA: sigma-70 family RNA polymerase sigma factor [Thermoanaerobaculia bacterium]|nr:sigma-70 family RNA polymerase sigma factor [Candidatus Binatia bacterium]HYC61888.1 sigma-70 family RNA polymerase sigma factor [Thermoanaerobaculia bacterium]